MIPPRLRPLLRSNPMRLTLRLVAVFVTISLCSFAVTWWLANEAVIDSILSSLDRQMQELSAPGSAAAIREAVTAAAGQLDPRSTIVQLRTADGRAGNFAGDLPAPAPRAAWVRDHALGIDGVYLLRQMRVPGGMLTLGAVEDAVEELREIYLRVLIFAILPTALLALVAGVPLALRSTRRLAAIDAALARLTAGDLAARVQDDAEAQDDLSVVAHAVNRLAAAQQASVEALRQVSADIAHELKTPIQRLAVLLDRARAEMGRGPAAEDLDRAADEVAGIVTTFQALLRIAQVEGGSPRARFEAVALGPLASSIAELYAPAAEEGGRALSWSVTGPATVEGDRSLLGQIVANLLENALRHTPPGTRVTLRVEGPVLSVADNGPGIPAQERGAVLRRLYRLDRSRTTPGNGLGLTLVDAVCRLHDARLTLLDNHPGLCVRIDFSDALCSGPRPPRRATTRRECPDGDVTDP